MNIFGFGGQKPQTNQPIFQDAKSASGQNGQGGMPNQLDAFGGQSGGQQQPEGQQQAPQGLDKFTDLFKMDSSKGDPATQNPASIYDIPPEKLQQMVGNQNFAANISPELMQKAMSGDHQAFMGVLNQVAQNAAGFNMNTMFSALKFSSGHERGQWEKDLPSKFKEFSASSSMENANPVFRHPAAAPMLEGLKSALIKSNPQATPEEINSMAQEYLTGFAENIMGGGKNSQQQSGSTRSQSGQDWGAFFNTSTSR